MHAFSQAEQARARTLLAIFIKVVAERHFPAEVGQALPALGPDWLLLVALGICSRESRFGLDLDQDGCGDGGHGRGLMQIDDRSHAEFIATQNWPDPETNIRYALKDVLVPFYNVLGDHFEQFGSDYGRLLQGAVAAFNCGPGNVLKALAAGEDIDARTTGGDYSADVLARAQALQALLGTAPGPTAAAPVPAPHADALPPWIAWARSKLGEAEGVSDADIDSWFKLTTLPREAWDCEKTPWCAVFVNAALLLNGMKSLHSARAFDYLSYGEVVTQPRLGDLVIFTFSHVAFYEADAGDRIKVIGGNQSNAVTEPTYPKAEVKGYRRPV